MNEVMKWSIDQFWPRYQNRDRCEKQYSHDLSLSFQSYFFNKFNKIYSSSFSVWSYEILLEWTNEMKHWPVFSQLPEQGPFWKITLPWSIYYSLIGTDSFLLNFLLRVLSNRVIISTMKRKWKKGRLPIDWSVEAI